MASKQGTVDFILEQITGAGTVEAKKMFGEYTLYCDGKIVALVADDQLYLKMTAAGKALLGAPVEASPYPGAKLCFLIPGEHWDDREWLTRLVQTTAAELPAAKKKAPRRK